MRFHDTREGWLHAAIEYMRPWFAEQAAEIPGVYVSVGFPSTGARSARIGECHYSGEDGKPQLFIHPGIKDSARVLDVLIHELCHAALPVGTQHGAAFGRLARGLGLTGKMTATVSTPELRWALNRVVSRGLGPYPHAELVTGSGGRKKQTTRMLKVVCEADGFTVRMTRKWLDDMGSPVCPCGQEMAEAE
jgi:hypothetical protein